MCKEPTSRGEVRHAAFTNSAVQIMSYYMLTVMLIILMPTKSLRRLTYSLPVSVLGAPRLQALYFKGFGGPELSST